MPIEVVCKECGKSFFVRPYKIKEGKGKFCSKNCYTKYFKKNPLSYWSGKKRNSPSEETRKKVSEKMKGRTLTEKHKKNISIGKKGKHNLWSKPPVRIGEENKKWKGKDVSYRNLHRWVERNLGKAKKCSVCGRVGIEKEIHWSNTDHKYKRNLDDWQELCAKCHNKYDKINNQLKQKYGN